MGEFKLVPLFLRKPSTEPLQAGLLETIETSFEPETAHQPAAE
jgi:hypothetical protein